MKVLPFIPFVLLVHIINTINADIENTYQSYREKAVKAGEMRNLLFMQAVAAYQSGDGARAKALSQRVRRCSLSFPLFFLQINRLVTTIK